MFFLRRLNNKDQQKRHRRIEAYNIAQLCEKFPVGYPSPSSFYFPRLQCPFKKAEIDIAVLRIVNEIDKEEHEKRERDRRHQHARQKSASFTRM